MFLITSDFCDVTNEVKLNDDPVSYWFDLFSSLRVCGGSWSGCTWLDRLRLHCAELSLSSGNCTLPAALLLLKQPPRCHLLSLSTEGKKDVQSRQTNVFFSSEQIKIWSPSAPEEAIWMWKENRGQRRTTGSYECAFDFIKRQGDLDHSEMLVKRSPRCAPVQTDRINAALFALFLETLRGPDLHLTPGDGSVPQRPDRPAPAAPQTHNSTESCRTRCRESEVTDGRPSLQRWRRYHRDKRLKLHEKMKEILKHKQLKVQLKYKDWQKMKKQVKRWKEDSAEALWAESLQEFRDTAVVQTEGRCWFKPKAVAVNIEWTVEVVAHFQLITYRSLVRITWRHFEYLFIMQCDESHC